jgi:hypothetical protein
VRRLQSGLQLRGIDNANPLILPAVFVARRGVRGGIVRRAAARAMRDVVDMSWIQSYFIKKYRWNPVPGRSRRRRALPSAPSTARYVIGNSHL